METVLDTDELPTSFISYSDLTQQQILQWALDHHGGNEFLGKLLEHHEDHLLRKFNSVGLEDKDISEIQEQ